MLLIRIMENIKYGLIERTPLEMQCGLQGCPAIYELTPRDMQCGFGACPAIYVTNRKPQNSECAGAFCPTIQEGKDGSYLIIGRQLTSQEIDETGLAKKVGKGEVLIEVPKKLIDSMQRDDRHKT